MDEQKRNLFRASDKDSHTSELDDNARQEREGRLDEAQEHGEHNERYYYAYGPYQSVKQEEPSRTTTSIDPAGRMNDVQVTPPNPVKPLPFSSVTQQGSAQANGVAAPNRGDGGGQSAPPQGGWNFKESKRKGGTSFKAMFASFMAGALVITALMVTADKANLFTGGTALAGEGAGSSAANAVQTNGPGTTLPNGSNSVADVFKKASPAVVKIETFATTSGQSGGNNPWMNDPFFRQFFGDSYGNDNSRQDVKPKLQPLGIGTGFIFDKEGYILTNQHVIEGAETIQVQVEGSKEPLKAELLGQSKDLDLAVLKIKSNGDLPTVSLGNSDATQIGDWLVAIGNPSGFDHTVTVGVLSARERKINVDDNGSAREYQHLLQTDASINPGNSGGPLLNMQGEVIGMNVAVSRQAQGIGFAIPSNVISKVVEDLKNKREIPKEPLPFIGATLITMTDDIADRLGMNLIKGSLVSEVLFGSPAYEADLRAYDIITGMDGAKFTTKEELIEQISKKKVGDTAKLQVVRNGKSIDVSVKIGDKNKFAKQLQQ
ncbi:trypsin-like peptidase domain-containing protein [Paenibacillus alvei]|uniref:Trypsin-like peptidase domain-containing protein n=1 Tax=Paenibacillus alvei TaxID=44250 RepID=A0ABT4H288_PAEAL|nr:MULTISPECIES: trypsin-like peptidase domain-containing protein [Paenibacillus]EJW16482.1 putative serine protease HtrA [Paenibacillus alvei DSM 29]MBG9737207.1 serine protease [Paenibacillus alvei]MBG9746301.1 serine protease [Paenibacillus alvei]MCY9542428.1 trypsin-like peptidase domain-containing protein [Paenibacillus alvei]MCY9581650.1 trypsin-like peptidase domain-containing protein [Paenibacillus alvei]